MTCLISGIFGPLLMRTFFDTLDILGAHSGTSEPSRIINHCGRALRGDSKTKMCCQTHTLLSTVFVLPLCVHQETRVAFDAASRCSQLIWSQSKCLDFHWKNWGGDTTQHKNIQTRAHMLNRNLSKLPRLNCFYQASHNSRTANDTANFTRAVIWKRFWHHLPLVSAMRRRREHPHAETVMRLVEEMGLVE